jgi:hypothetical protein
MSVNEINQSLADGMRNVTEDIIASHNVRVKTLGGLLADTRKMISNNAADRKAMSKEQAAELARYAGDLASSTGPKLKGFRKELEIVAKELKGRLCKEANNLRDSVNKMLTDYHKDHAEMSAATRSHLRGFVKDIVKGVEDLTATTRVLMTGYRTDIRKAGNIWSEMTRTLAKAGSKRAALPVIRAGQKVGTVKEAALPVIRAVQKVGTVKEAVVKIQKRKKRKK